MPGGTMKVDCSRSHPTKRPGASLTLKYRSNVKYAGMGLHARAPMYGEELGKIGNVKDGYTR